MDLILLGVKGCFIEKVDIWVRYRKFVIKHKKTGINATYEITAVFYDGYLLVELENIIRDLCCMHNISINTIETIEVFIS